MHHSLKLYSRYQKSFLRMYIFFGKMTRIPLVGRLVRRVANYYGENIAGGFVLTTEEAGQIVDRAEHLALGPCSCRETFHHCDGPIGAEIMVGLGKQVFSQARPGKFRDISAEEARDILRLSHQKGLIHTIVKCRDDFYAICNCCTCCCVPLRLNKRYGIGMAVRRRMDIVDLVAQGKPL